MKGLASFLYSVLAGVCIGIGGVVFLSCDNKVVGAALFCLEQGVDPSPIITGIVAALKFDRADDPTAPEIQKALREQGVEYVMQRYMSLQPDEPLYGMILKAWQA